jgi:hypothetical protein
MSVTWKNLAGKMFKELLGIEITTTTIKLR